MTFLPHWIPVDIVTGISCTLGYMRLLIDSILST